MVPRHLLPEVLSYLKVCLDQIKKLLKPSNKGTWNNLFFFLHLKTLIVVLSTIHPQRKVAHHMGPWIPPGSCFWGTFQTIYSINWQVFKRLSDYLPDYQKDSKRTHYYCQKYWKEASQGSGDIGSFFTLKFLQLMPKIGNAHEDV